jgi:GDP-L-fucose synthase
MKKILLTGGNGFIGKNIKESYLANKYEITAPKSSELNLVDTEQVDKYFENNEFDIVIHAAGKPGHRNAKDTSNLFYTNTKMFFNLTRHSDKYNKFINLGSGAIYDMRHYKSKINEDYSGTFIPIDEHGFTKYVCGKYIENTKNIIDLRIFGIFGKYEDYAIRFISNAICKTLFDMPITIKQNRNFDYLFVEDLMPILGHFIENDAKHNAYNITPHNSIELLELAKLIKEISGKNLTISTNQTGMGLDYSGDNTRLCSEIKNIKFTNYSDAINKLYQWYTDNIQIVNKDLLLLDK